MSDNIYVEVVTAPQPDSRGEYPYAYALAMTRDLGLKCEFSVGWPVAGSHLGRTIPVASHDECPHCIIQDWSPLLLTGPYDGSTLVFFPGLNSTFEPPAQIWALYENIIVVDLWDTVNDYRICYFQPLLHGGDCVEHERSLTRCLSNHVGIYDFDVAEEIWRILEGRWVGK